MFARWISPILCSHFTDAQRKLNIVNSYVCDSAICLCSMLSPFFSLKLNAKSDLKLFAKSDLKQPFRFSNQGCSLGQEGKAWVYCLYSDLLLGRWSTAHPTFSFMYNQEFKTLQDRQATATGTSQESNRRAAINHLSKAMANFNIDPSQVKYLKSSATEKKTTYCKQSTSILRIL